MILFAQAAIYVRVAMGIDLVGPERLSPAAFHPFCGFVPVGGSGFLGAWRDQMAGSLYRRENLGGLFIAGLGGERLRRGL
ncbi:MAG: hypothetical protein M0Z91_03435 [Actinomycetota bacterium]|nr:hypothetical protein [Actinomycetota bacterium]